MGLKEKLDESGTMRGRKTGGRTIVLGLGARERVRLRAAQALSESEIGQVFSEAGACEIDESAGSALRAILAEKAAEYTMRAVKESKRRGTKFGAAALIIAAEKDRW